MRSLFSESLRREKQTRVQSHPQRRERERERGEREKRDILGLFDLSSQPFKKKQTVLLSKTRRRRRRSDVTNKQVEL